jgi:hypothetical protein
MKRTLAIIFLIILVFEVKAQTKPDGSAAPISVP